MSSNVSVLFVCMGNICRSPAADGLFSDLVQRRNLSERIAVDSAGTHGYHVGDLADPRMREAASHRGYELTSRARRVTEDDLQDFDLVIAMDRENLTRIEGLDVPPETRFAEVCLFSRFLDESWPTDVPDPYYGGQQGFEYVLDMIEAGCPKVMDWLQHRMDS